ncbi:hypothetical protein BH24CHL9_BH24CHL9_09350 [soil metagenome]
MTRELGQRIAADRVSSPGSSAVAARIATGSVRTWDIGDRLANDALGVPGEPVALFTLSCLEAQALGLLSDPRFAGCIDFMREDGITAAVEAAARVLMGQDVPARIIAAHQATISE